METSIRVGSRSSPLALIQVEEVFALLKAAGQQLDYDLIKFTTQGDRDKTTSLTTNPADDFFTNTIDAAILDGAIDVGVHSAKDLPQNLNPRLAIFALTESLDETDAFVGRAPLADLPAGSRIGTSSVLRQEGLRAINPSLVMADIRGTIQDRLRQLDEGKYDGIIVAACALKRLGLTSRITGILPWPATPLQGQLAVVGRVEDVHLRELFRRIDVRERYGRVVLTGAGPGDPELITLKAVRALRSADVVFYDYLAHPDLLSYAPRARKIFVGKRKGAHTMPQDELCRMLKEQALAGQRVVRLKGGDPFIFARGADELHYLRAYHIPVEVIPGISSATGIPSSLGVPLTARGVSASVAFVSGHPGPIQIPTSETLVFLMGITRLDEIVTGLRGAGWRETAPVLLVSRGTRVEERIVRGTIGDIEAKVASSPLEPPVLIIVGETVRFWVEHPRPVTLYLGTNPEKYRAIGRLVPFPMIEILPAEITAEESADLRNLSAGYDVVLLTSRHGVRHFFAHLDRNHLSNQDFSRLRFAVIGQDTALELIARGIQPAVVAVDETSPGMLTALESAGPLAGLRILFPRSSLPNPFLKRELTRRGAQVTELTIYLNRKPPRKELPSEAIDQIFFTSPSTVTNFLADYGVIPPQWRIISKGKTTGDTLRNAGYNDFLNFADTPGV